MKMDSEESRASDDMEEEVPDDEEEDDEEEGNSEEVVISYACEDCDYRWEVTYDDEEEAQEAVQYCPMCGSANSTQI